MPALIIRGQVAVVADRFGVYLPFVVRFVYYSDRCSVIIRDGLNLSIPRGRIRVVRRSARAIVYFRIDERNVHKRPRPTTKELLSAVRRVCQSFLVSGTVSILIPFYVRRSFVYSFIPFRCVVVRFIRFQFLPNLHQYFSEIVLPDVAANTPESIIPIISFNESRVPGSD